MSLIERPSGLLDDFYRPFGGLFNQGFPSRLLPEAEVWQPSVDIKREDDGYLIEVEVPGLSPEQVEVEAHDNVLTIQGTRETSDEEKTENFLRRERRFGKFVRRFTLPNSTSADDISAQVKDGVLHVRVPDGQSASPQKIAVG